MVAERVPTPSMTGRSDPGPSVAGGAADATLSEALLTLRKRKWVLVVAAILGLAYGIYKVAKEPKVYEAYGRIEVRAGSSNEFRVTAEPGFGDTQNKMLTEVAILSSDSLMLTVARQLKLQDNQEFLGEKGPVPHRSLDVPEVREATVSKLQSTLGVELVPKTDIIRISYVATDPKLATDIVNTVISAYIHRSYETRFESTQRVSQWLQGQLDDLKQQVETSQERLMPLQRRLGILGFDPNRNQISSELEDLSKAADQTRLSRIIAESRYRVLSGMDPDTIEGSIDVTPGTAPGELNALRGQIATTRANMAQLMANLGPKHPQVLALKAQIDELQREIGAEQNRLLLQAKQTYIAAKANEDQTNATLEAQQTAAYKLGDDLIDYQLRQREFESNRTLYESLLQRLRTAGVQAGLESLEIDIVDRALLPASPVLQSQTSVILTTLVFSLIGGIVIAFLLESLDTGLRGVAEIEQITELPSLAVIPRARRASAEEAAQISTAQRNIGVIFKPKSQFSEAFRSLRTSLLLSTAGHPPRMILFTSATPSEGKTTAATNLAAVLAQGDARVMLIDADLRRPNVHHRFGLNGRVGLTTLLTGASTLEQTIQHVPEIPNLDLIASGPVPPLPTEMLASDSMRELLRSLDGKYTHIIIDTPPILSVTDGIILAREADAVVLVVRHGKSNKHVVRRARDLLLRSGAVITGIVLNAIDVSSPEYYGYYGYSKYNYSAADSGSWEPRKDKEGVTPDEERR